MTVGRQVIIDDGGDRSLSPTITTIIFIDCGCLPNETRFRKCVYSCKFKGCLNYQFRVSIKEGLSGDGRRGTGTEYQKGTLGDSVSKRDSSGTVGTGSRVRGN